MQQNSDAPSRMISRYEIGQTLGSGMSGKVKLGIDVETGEKVALKLINKSRLASSRQKVLVEREVNAMKSLSHKHILKLLEVDYDAQYQKKNGEVRRVILLVIEFGGNHELFDFLVHGGPFSEAQARTYFKDLLSALEYCHSKGVYHRDLKPENLMLGDDYELKLADFGLAAISMIEHSDSNEFFETQCGTRAYMAPEMLTQGKYRGAQVDIWSAGVILFIMMTGHPPFEIALGKDWWFNAIKHGRYDKFWAAHLRSTPNFPVEAQNFLNTIFVVDPENRATIEELKAHEWLQGETLEPSELSDQISVRRQAIEQKKMQELEKAKKQKERKEAMLKKIQQRNRKRVNFHSNIQTRSLLNSPLDLPKHIQQYNVTFTSASSSEMLDYLAQIIEDMNGQVEKKDLLKFKVKGIFAPTVFGVSRTVYLHVQLYSHDDVCAIHIQRVNGTIFDYRKIKSALAQKIEEFEERIIAEEGKEDSSPTCFIAQEEETVITDTVDLI